MGITPARFIRMDVLGMSQTQLSRKLGITQERISVIESGHGIYPEKYREIMRTIAVAKKKKLLDAWFDVVPLLREARATVAKKKARP